MSPLGPSARLLAEELHVKFLLMERLKVVACQLIRRRQITQFVSRAGVVRIPQLDKDVEFTVAAVPFGTRHVDGTRIEISRREAAVLLRASDLDDVATIGTPPTAA